MLISYIARQNILGNLNRIYNLIRRENPALDRATILLVLPCAVENPPYEFKPHNIDFYIMEDVSVPIDKAIIITRDITVKNFDFEKREWVSEKTDLTFQQALQTPTGINIDVISRCPQYNATVKIK